MHLWLVKVSALTEYEYTLFLLKLFHENELSLFHPLKNVTIEFEEVSLQLLSSNYYFLEKNAT